ncbi:MAG TPA: tetratricopeptide repeat protein [Pyrinomonadaceae bacterium]|nr:tetratricopeptide repeat protein [Pyrinomonadaceae bacterium]
MKNAPKTKPAKPKSVEPETQSSLLDELAGGTRALFITIAATVLVYANSLSGAFVFDDTKQIVGNPSLRSWSSILSAFTSDVWYFQRQTLTADVPPPYYRPLFSIYLTVNYQLFGLWEPGWHLINLLVHTTATVLVYYLLQRLSRDNVVALLAALLFGVHPAHVESVSWISGIPDPLAALFYIPSMIWYVRYREEGDRKWLVASVVAFGMSVLCKETPLALPMVLAAWEFTRMKGEKSWASRIKKIIPQMVPYAIVGAVYLAIRFSVLGRLSWKHPFMARVPDSAIWMTVPYVFVNYLRHLIAPFNLSLIYGTSFITSAAEPRFLLPVLLLLVLGGALWVYRKKLSAQVWVALALMIAPILPVLNLKVFHYEYIIQDRYLYLPSIGFCYLIAIVIRKLCAKRASLLLATSAAILLTFGASTILQNRVWHDAVALWQRATYYSPNSWSTHYNLGLAYLGFKQYEPAQAELLEARRLDPNRANVYNNLAMAQAGLGHADEAIANVKAALALDPRLLEAHNNLGAFLYDKGNYAEAKLEFARVLETDPSSDSARFNMARTLAAMGNHPAAIREYEALLAKVPNDVAAHYQLGLSYAATGRKNEALTELGRGLAMDRDANRVAEMRKKVVEIQAQ